MTKEEWENYQNSRGLTIICTPQPDGTVLSRVYRDGVLVTDDPSDTPTTWEDCPWKPKSNG